MGQRSRVVRPVAGRVAAVAVPLVRHPRLGESLVVTRRAVINGHTGARMSNAGEIVLFGGSVEPGESPREAALRELCEESGTMSLLDHPDLAVHASLGTWVTESGFRVEGFCVDLPAEFVQLAQPEPREVAELAYLPTPLIRAANVAIRAHVVDPRDHRLDGGAAEFESPTIRVRHPDTGAPWVLWGLAGYMVEQWRKRESERAPW